MTTTNSESSTTATESDDSDLEGMSADDKATMTRLRSDARGAAKHERRLAGIAIRHVRPGAVDAALSSYADAVKSGNVPAAGEDADDHASRHFRDFAKLNPSYARPKPAPVASALARRGRW